jgi:hypothetical protein
MKKKYGVTGLDDSETRMSLSQHIQAMMSRQDRGRRKHERSRGGPSAIYLEWIEAMRNSGNSAEMMEQAR